MAEGKIKVPLPRSEACKLARRSRDGEGENAASLLAVMPGQIPTPAFRWVTHAYGHGNIWLPGRFLRQVAQMHPGLFERFPPFTPVAGNATGDDVRPVRRPAVRPGNDMVVGEFADRRLAPTVLALIVVAGIDILA